MRTIFRLVGVAAPPAALMAAWNADEKAAAFAVPVRAGFTEYPLYGLPLGNQTLAGRTGSLSAGIPPGRPGSHVVWYIAGRIDSSIAGFCADIEMQIESAAHRLSNRGPSGG